MDSYRNTKIYYASDLPGNIAGLLISNREEATNIITSVTGLPFPKQLSGNGVWDIIVFQPNNSQSQHPEIDYYIVTLMVLGGFGNSPINVMGEVINAWNEQDKGNGAAPDIVLQIGNLIFIHFYGMEITEQVMYGNYIHKYNPFVLPLTFDTLKIINVPLNYVPDTGGGLFVYHNLGQWLKDTGVPFAIAVAAGMSIVKGAVAISEAASAGAIAETGALETIASSSMPIIKPALTTYKTITSLEQKLSLPPDKPNPTTSIIEQQKEYIDYIASDRLLNPPQQSIQTVQPKQNALIPIGILLSLILLS